MKEKMKVSHYGFSTRIEGEGELVRMSDSYFETLEVQGFSPRTIETYAFVLLTFFRFVDGSWVKFQKFTQKNLQDWMIELSQDGKSPSSINQRLCCVRAFYRFCFGKSLPHAPGVLYPNRNFHAKRRRGFLGISPVKPNNHTELRVKKPRRAMDPMRPREVDQFLADIQRYRDLGITLTMLLCGLRRQEITLLLLEDVDFNRNSIKIFGKGNRERIVPMPFCLMQVLARYLEVERPIGSCDNFFVVLQGERIGQGMTNAGIRSLFRKRRDRLGLPKARPHQFRHVFASDLARSGVPLTTIQRLLGHADPKTSLIYIDLFVEDIQADYDKAMKVIEARYAALPK